MQNPIRISSHFVQALTDTDKYKLFALYYYWTYHRDVKMRFDFINRHAAKVKLHAEADMDLIRSELDHVKSMQFTPDELEYIKSVVMPFANPEFFTFLENFELPDYYLGVENDELVLYTEHTLEASMWEIYFLIVVNQARVAKFMSTNHLTEKDLLDAATERYFEKLTVFQEYGKPLREADFATRRRASFSVQYHIYQLDLLYRPESIIGTSNVYIAMHTGTKAIGTHPHECIMVEQGTSKDIKELRDSQMRFVHRWQEIMPKHLCIFLTDTHGADAFWNQLDHKTALGTAGYRWDSGPWDNWTQRALETFNHISIKPKDQTMVYSDGLTAEVMIEIHKTYAEIFKDILFGRGTDRSFDLGGVFKKLGFKAISIVVKPTSVNDQPVAKLSANPNKATGEKAAVARLREAANYNPEHNLAAPVQY